MAVPDVSTTCWRKSSRSTDQPNCVEVAALGAAVAVRDSKNSTGTTLIIPPPAWAALTTALRTGELS